MPFINPPPTGLPLKPPQVPTSFSTPGLPAGELPFGLCKIKLPPLPSLGFLIPFKIPSIAFPPKIPIPPLRAIPYNCLLGSLTIPLLGSFPSNNPFDYSDVPAGGGRVSNQLPDPDAAFDTTETP